MNYNGKNALVIGKGISGIGAAEALKMLGANVRVVETDDVPSEIYGSDIIVISPSVRPNHPVFTYAAIKDIRVLGEIGLGAEINDKPVIGITGTNGKTTLVDMLEAVYGAAGIKTAVCGNIGRSFSRRAIDKNYDRVLLELSSFQLLQCAPLSPHIACITNIEEDHLDYHGSIFEYRRAKMKITERQTKNDFLVIRNSSDFPVRTEAKIVHAYPVEYEISARGLHNKMNAGFAATIASIDGIDDNIIRNALEAFTPRDYRITLVAEINGTKYFNDSKGTNVSATLAATQTMQGTTALILGGSDKGCSFESLFENMPDCISLVLAVGQTASRIIAAANAKSFSNIINADCLSSAVKEASMGGFENVLFSPACASFDEYANYAERGAAFNAAVRSLSG